MPQPVILIADDQKHMLLLLQASLASVGARILTASSGEEAIAKAATSPVNLLLIDFEMSGLNGVETARLLKKSPLYADLPIILITARGQNRVRAEAIEAGVSLVVLKPFSPAELLVTVQGLLDKAASPPDADRDQKL